MRVIFHKQFEKQYRKTSRRIRERFKERKNLLIENPTHSLLNTHQLSGSRYGQWSINVTGDWRAIFIYLDEGTIAFIDLDTHSNLYG